MSPLLQTSGRHYPCRTYRPRRLSNWTGRCYRTICSPYTTMRHRGLVNFDEGYKRAEANFRTSLKVYFPMRRARAVLSHVERPTPRRGPTPLDGRTSEARDTKGTPTRCLGNCRFCQVLASADNVWRRPLLLAKRSGFVLCLLLQIPVRTDTQPPFHIERRPSRELRREK